MDASQKPRAGMHLGVKMSRMANQCLGSSRVPENPLSMALTFMSVSICVIFTWHKIAFSFSQFTWQKIILSVTSEFTFPLSRE